MIGTPGIRPRYHAGYDFRQPCPLVAIFDRADLSPYQPCGLADRAIGRPHWYGLTYLVAFGLFMLLGIRRLRHEPFASITGPGSWTRSDVEDILFLGMAGALIGGRVGHCLFYKPGYYLSHSLEILAIWTPGMSFMVAC